LPSNVLLPSLFSDYAIAHKLAVTLLALWKSDAECQPLLGEPPLSSRGLVPANAL
jgi:hypothetical protein